MESGLDRYTWEGTLWSDSNFCTRSEMVSTCTDVSTEKEQNSLNGCI